MINHNNVEVHADSQMFVRHPTAGILVWRYDRRPVSAAGIEPQRKDLVSRATSVDCASVCIFVHCRFCIRLGVISKPNVCVFPGPSVKGIAAQWDDVLRA